MEKHVSTLLAFWSFLSLSDKQAENVTRMFHLETLLKHFFPHYGQINRKLKA